MMLVRCEKRIETKTHFSDTADGADGSGTGTGGHLYALLESAEGDGRLERLMIIAQTCARSPKERRHLPCSSESVIQQAPD